MDVFRKEKRERRVEERKSPIFLTPDRKLNREEKRRLIAAFKKAWRDGKVPKTAQQTIPYQEMRRDGICVVTDHYFTKQIQFYDITYQLAQNEDKNQIFESYCEFLNYSKRPCVLPEPVRYAGYQAVSGAYKSKIL